MKNTVSILLYLAVFGLMACTERAETPTPPDTAEIYAKGMEYLDEGGEANLNMAIEHFVRSVEIDPSFALGHAGLSRAYTDIGGNYNIMPPNESWPKAKAAADQAVSLDADLAEAHLALALVSAGYEWDWEGAEQHFQHALALDENNTDVLADYAWFLYSVGRSDEALAIMDRTRGIDPDYENPHLDYFARGGSDDAVRIAREWTESNPGSPYGYWTLGNIYVAEDDFEKVVENMTIQIPLMEGDVTDEVAILGYAYGRLGREDDAMEALATLDALPAQGRYVSPVVRAWIYIGMGDNDEAIALLQQGAEERAHRSGSDMISFARLYKPISDDPRFTALLDGMNLPN
jgi:tetratricopeptide (TPR) repeat protein